MPRACCCRRSRRALRGPAARLLPGAPHVSGRLASRARRDDSASTAVENGGRPIDTGGAALLLQTVAPLLLAPLLATTAAPAAKSHCTVNLLTVVNAHTHMREAIIADGVARPQ